MSDFAKSCRALDSAESRRVPSFETRHTIKARRKCFKIKSFDIHLKLKI